MIIGVGLDLTEVKRIREEVERGGEESLAAFLTPAEIATCRSKRRPHPSYAVRFAVKEAFVKALGTGFVDGMSWRDMEVRLGDGGKPALHLTGRAEEVARARGVGSIHVSLTHEREYAAAVVVLEG